MYDEHHKRRSSLLAVFPPSTPVGVIRPVRVSVGYLLSTVASLGLLFAYSAVSGTYEYPISGGNPSNPAPTMALVTVVAAFVAGSGRPAARGFAAVGTIFCVLIFGATVLGGFQAGEPVWASVFAGSLLAQIIGIVLLGADARFFDEAKRARKSRS